MAAQHAASFFFMWQILNKKISSIIVMILRQVQLQFFF